MGRLMEGDESAQNDFDKWDKIISTHPETMATEAREEKEWQQVEGPLSEQALETMRGFVPIDIQSQSSDSLTEKGVRREEKKPALCCMLYCMQNCVYCGVYCGVYCACCGRVLIQVFPLLLPQVPKAIIRRLFTKKILWMVRMDPAYIANLHR